MENGKLRKRSGKGTAFYGSVIENADYLVGIEISKERKKRVRVDVEDSRWDKTYLSFLVDLENYLEMKFEEEDDEEDPVYASFLQHLTEHGNGYKLGVSMEHGVCTPITYEVGTPKRKPPRTCQGSNTRKEARLDVDRQLKSHRKCSRFADPVKTDSRDTMKKLNTRACQGASILKKGSFDANKELKSAPKNSGFVNVVQTDPSIVVKKEIFRNCERYNLRKTGNVEANAQLKSDLKNTKTVNEVEADSLDEISRETSMPRHGYSMRKRSGLEADKQLKAGLKNTKTVNKVEADSLDEISRENSRTRHDYSMRKRSGLEADKQLKAGLRKCKVEKDPLDVNEVEANSLGEISKETSRTRGGYNMRKRSGLEADEQLKPGLKRCKVEKDPLDVNDRPSITRQGSYIRKEGSSSVNRELKSGLRNSVFVNEEGDPSQVLKRNTSRTRPDGNIQKKGDLHTDKMVKPARAFQVKGAHEVDETYNSFFAGLKFTGDSMVYEFGDRQQILYEGSAQQISTDNDDEVEAKATEASPRPPTRSPEMPSCSRPLIKTEPIVTLAPLSPTVTLTPLSPSATPTPLSPTATPTPLSLTATPTPLSPTATPTATPTPLSLTATPTPLSPTITPTPLSLTAHRNTDKAPNKNGKGSQKNHHSKLWKQLHRILAKPFDQNELNELWKDMSYSSEVQIYRDSRSGGTYKPGHMGKSYLDKYPELNGEIEKVKSDSSKVLNLLRMLVFYLKNVPHGIPRPWMPDYRKMFLP